MSKMIILSKENLENEEKKIRTKCEKKANKISVYQNGNKEWKIAYEINFKSYRC